MLIVFITGLRDSTNDSNYISSDSCILYTFPDRLSESKKRLNTCLMDQWYAQKWREKKNTKKAKYSNENLRS